MQRLEVSGAVRLIYRLLGVKGLNNKSFQHWDAIHSPIIKNNDINSTITNLCLLVPSHSNG